MSSLDDLKAYLLDETVHYPALAPDRVGGHASAQVSGARVMALLDAAIVERDAATARAERAEAELEAERQEVVDVLDQVYSEWRAGAQFENMPLAIAARLELRRMDRCTLEQQR